MHSWVSQKTCFSGSNMHTQIYVNFTFCTDLPICIYAYVHASVHTYAHIFSQPQESLKSISMTTTSNCGIIWTLIQSFMSENQWRQTTQAFATPEELEKLEEDKESKVDIWHRQFHCQAYFYQQYKADLTLYKREVDKNVLKIIYEKSLSKNLQLLTFIKLYVWASVGVLTDWGLCIPTFILWCY